MLDGAKAFALPTKFGQSLEVEPSNGNTIKWTSYDADGSIWFDEELPIEAIISNQPHADKAEVITLIKILHKAHKANPTVLQDSNGFTVNTRLTFPRHWGLGTSSTLINNVAQWFNINAYTLLAESFGGSGYDIACAQHNTAVLYQINGSNPIVSSVDFNPVFKDNIWFVYLNQKQNSREAIAAYREHRKDIAPIIARIDALTNDAILARDTQTFASALEKHEALMAGLLGMAPVQERLFPDFKGVIKSLGAWGGDFVMAVAEDNQIHYFLDKGYKTIISYQAMIL